MQIYYMHLLGKDALKKSLNWEIFRSFNSGYFSNYLLTCSCNSAMVQWAEMHVLQIDIACPFEHFGDPQLTKPDSEKGGQKANPKWHHLTRRIDRDCGWCDDCDRWQSLTMQIAARDPTPRDSITHIGIVSHHGRVSYIHRNDIFSEWYNLITYQSFPHQP